MKLKIYHISILISLISLSYIKAQVVASDDNVLCVGQEGEPITLTATSFATDLLPSGINSDDTYGGVVDMGFDFDFYGNTYNQVVLSSNNYLTFNTALAGTGSGWAIGAAVPNNFDAPMNAILCPWQDIYPGVNGNGIIAYATTGEAPNRVFIASFCGIPMFSCTDICYSSQIKLFESTNIIETHIAQKVLCTTWNDGAAIHALHNIDGTIAHVVTGLDGIERNYPNQWTCENDSWQFIPDENNTNNYTIENIEFSPAVASSDIIWQDEFGNLLETLEDGSVEIFPGGDVTYIAAASLCGEAGDWCEFEGGVGSDAVNITFEELPIIGEVISQISCYNSNNASIEVTALSDGEWIYNLYLDGLIYESVNSAEEQVVFNNLGPGLYSASITEVNSNCISEEVSFNIEEPEALIYEDNTQQVTCFDGNDGLIELQINGGTAPYTTILYANGVIINEQSGQSIVFDNLPAGNYDFSTFDENGCLFLEGDEIPFTITEPLEIIIDESHNNILCNGDNSGGIDITVLNCNGCVYEWSNGAETEDISNLQAGTYDLIVTDENECTKSMSIEITEPLAMNASAISTDCNCFGDFSGAIDVVVTGGVEEYNYIWTNEVGETISIEENISNLPAGVYSVNIADGNGCTVSIQDIEITEPSDIVFMVEASSNDLELAEFCENFGDGWIDLSVIGGVGDYTFSSSNSIQIETEDMNNAIINNLTTGTYNVSVTDENGCSKDITQYIAENEELVIESTLSECVDSTGSISLTVTGCAGTCEYIWTNLQGDTISLSTYLNEQEVGNYTLEAQDAFGCVTQRNFTINAKPTADFEVEENQFYLSNTPVEFIDLSYDTDVDQIASRNWDFGDGNNTIVYSNDEIVTHLYTTPGTYYTTLSVLDQEGCVDEISKKIEVLQEYYSYTPSIFTPNGDGLNDTFKPSLLNIEEDSYTLTIFDRWGNKVFHTNDYKKGWDGKLKNGDFLPPDVYSYKILYSTIVGGDQEEKGKLIMAK